MSERDDGGKAFPHANPAYDGNWDKIREIGGMSLRDYFAARALPMLMQQYGVSSSSAVIAGMAYVAADAMLAERRRPAPSSDRESLGEPVWGTDPSLADPDA